MSPTSGKWKGGGYNPRVGQFALLSVSNRLVKVLCMKEIQSEESHRQGDNLDAQVYLPLPLGCSFESLPRCNKTRSSLDV